MFRPITRDYVVGIGIRMEDEAGDSDDELEPPVNFHPEIDPQSLLGEDNLTSEI